MASKTVLETLEAARKLIDTPDKWAKGTCARGKTGREVDCMGKMAVSFCPFGALYRVTNGDMRKAAIRLESVMDSCIPDFNDFADRTHAEVLWAFDAAIAKEKEAQHVL